MRREHPFSSVSRRMLMAFLVNGLLACGSNDANSRTRPNNYDPGDTPNDPQTSTNPRVTPPLRAIHAPTSPTIDGVADEQIWQDAYAYPLAFNQLSTTDMSPPSSQNDIYGTIRLVYDGTKIYGVLNRTDDVTVTNRTDPWENDNFELFYRIGTAWKQLRTIVGQDWHPSNMPVAGKAQWSADGAVLEFWAELDLELVGHTIGFNAALSDNDAASGARKCQLYPIPGSNKGYQGQGLGELTFADAAGAFVDGDVAGDAMLFASAAAASPPPTIDGSASDLQWTQATRYPLSYNQLAMDQSVPLTGAYPATFRLLSSGNTLYGLVQIAATEAARYDGAEVALAIEGNPVVLTSDRGADFAPGAALGAHAVWSEDGQTLEFMMQISAATLSGKQAHFSLGLRGVRAGTGECEVGLFPFSGYKRLAAGGGCQAFGDGMAEQGIDTAVLQLR